jgi:hypothetical protein
MLKTSIIEIAELRNKDRAQMFDLYAAYYEGAEAAVFHRDLSAKDFVVLMTSDDEVIRGFSTLCVYRENWKGQNVRVLYSGDTIIERDYWGQNQFSKVWLELAGRIKAEDPSTPLYWLLIVKGHRTYRYLSLFSKEYFPRHDLDTPNGFQSLMDHLAQRKFGNSYDPDSGLIRFPEPRSFLSEDLAIIPAKDSQRPEVKYFLRRNPKYYEGDELLCLCELQPEKLTRLARQWFEDGCKQVS